MIDSLSRFANCTLLINKASGHAAQIFLDDWVRTLGKPRRIITDRGGPTLQGEAWANLSHIFGWQMIRAPKFHPNQNGMAERSTRSLKIAVKNLIAATQALAPTQEILTQAVIAKNHVPHAVTGVPPAMAMTGRCDILAGHGMAAFTHDPNASDSLGRSTNNLSNILNARNAIIMADASYAIKTMLSRKPPGRFMTHFTPGAAVQIATKQSWIGTYRVVSVLGSSLVLERANRIFKWPKCKTRVIHDLENERFGSTVVNPDTVESDSLIPLPLQEIETKEVVRRSAPHEEDDCATEIPPMSEGVLKVNEVPSAPNAIQFLSQEIVRSSALNGDSFNDSKDAPNFPVDIHGVITRPHHPLEVKNDMNFVLLCIIRCHTCYLSPKYSPQI